MNGVNTSDNVTSICVGLKGLPKTDILGREGALLQREEKYERNYVCGVNYISEHYGIPIRSRLSHIFCSLLVFYL